MNTLAYKEFHEVLPPDSAGRDFPVYIVLTEEEGRVWPNHLGGARLEEVLRTRDWSAARRDHGMVVLRTIGTGAAR